MSLSRKLALVVGALWAVGIATGLGRDASLVEPWSLESEDMKFAARLLEGDDSDASDENYVQGADAGDVTDAGQSEAAAAIRSAALRVGGDEQSAEPDDEEAGKDLSKGEQTQSSEEGTTQESSGEAAVPDGNSEIGRPQAQQYNQRSTNVGSKRSSMDRE